MDNYDTSLMGVSMRDVKIRVIPQNWLARVLWRWIVYGIAVTWAEIEDE